MGVFVGEVREKNNRWITTYQEVADIATARRHVSRKWNEERLTCVITLCDTKPEDESRPIVCMSQRDIDLIAEYRNE